jgi:hypothetical protein
MGFTPTQRLRESALPEPSEALPQLRLAKDVAGLDVEEVFVPAEHDVVVEGNWTWKYDREIR